MPQPSRAERKYDVVVWGATGFTGRLVAEYLLERYGQRGALRWAIGGRDPDKLTSIAVELGAPKLPTIVADSTDAAAMHALAREAAVVCTTVGPYARYGSDLVAACAAHGTHYCDLAGEPQWIHQMIAQHHDKARATGARIVHCCGFDSIPSDLGNWYLQDQMIAAHGKPCDEVRLRVRKMSGKFSGGTIASMLNAIDESRRSRDARRALGDPYSLLPADAARGPDRTDRIGPCFDQTARSWIAPFVMAPINAKVVRRSNALLDFRYGTDFRYNEAVLTGKGIAGALAANSMAAAMAGFMLLATPKATRTLMNRLFLPQPGEGPDREARERGFFDMRLYGLADKRLMLSVSVTGKRDPGYGATSRMLGETAVCLALDDLTAGGGSWTPAACLGGTLIERLTANAGMRFEVIQPTS